MPEANYHVVENPTIEKTLEEGSSKAEREVKGKSEKKGKGKEKGKGKGKEKGKSKGKSKEKKSNHSHKKGKDSLEGSLVRVLFEAELEFPNILVSRLPQNTSNVNTESTKKSKQLYYLCDQHFGALIYLHFIVLLLICF